MVYVGQRKFEYINDFHGKKFHDNQISNVYLAKVPFETEFKVQKSEVELVKWFEFGELLKSVRNNLVPNCIREEELVMMENYFGGAHLEA